MAAVTAYISKYQTASGTRYRVRITNRRLLKEADNFNRAGFRTRREAEAYARTVQERVSRLESNQVELSHTLGELADHYIEDALPRLNPKDQRCRVAQLTWWRAQLGEDLLLANLTAKRISDAMRVLARKPVDSAPRGKRKTPKGDHAPRTIAPGTINRYRAAIGAVCAYGVKELHWLDANPVTGTRTQREARGRIRYLEPDEIERLGNAVEKQGGHLPLLFWLGLSTGARLGELLSARWDDVRFEPVRTATITLSTSKNGEPRVLPVALPKATQLLRLQRMKYRKENPLVIPPEKDGKRHSRWYQLWRKALAEAGVMDFRFHDLRHCFASYLAMSGHDHIQIADLTGHKSFAMVKRYAHLNPKARLANAASAVAAMGLSASSAHSKSSRTE